MCRQGREDRPHGTFDAKTRGHILAVDLYEGKLAAVGKEMKRIGVTLSGRPVMTWGPPAAIENRFDRILLDAPCSGMGVIRRNPDTKWRASEDGTQALCTAAENPAGSRCFPSEKGGRFVLCRMQFRTRRNRCGHRRFSRKESLFCHRLRAPLPGRFPPLLEKIGEMTDSIAHSSSARHRRIFLRMSDKKNPIKKGLRIAALLGLFVVASGITAYFSLTLLLHSDEACRGSGSAGQRGCGGSGNPHRHGAQHQGGRVRL
jgi:hypothetical protein